ncbi:MAG TPA: holo-[acyl-carrier-protein] synthase [Deltaproteobacteria bacterium]|nr:holo-[acyl-carrier-protein] synthase [Deltaproteobacteria bacterium]
MVGIDIVDIARISGILERHGERFLGKVFTPREIDYARGRKKSMEQSLAGRFAAKEAFMKASGRRLAFTDIEVLSQAGRPFIMFRGNRYDEVSISHEKSYAVSVVIRKDVKKGDI